jgi:hypothetical protein
VVVLASCTPAVRTQTALDVVDATYAAAMSSCLMQEGAIVAAARAGRITPEAALADFDEVSQRCFRTRAAFEVVLDLIEDGRLEEAAAALKRLKGGT